MMDKQCEMCETSPAMNFPHVLCDTCWTRNYIYTQVEEIRAMDRFVPNRICNDDNIVIMVSAIAHLESLTDDEYIRLSRTVNTIVSRRSLKVLPPEKES